MPTGQDRITGIAGFGNHVTRRELLHVVAGVIGAGAIARYANAQAPAPDTGTRSSAAEPSPTILMCFQRGFDHTI